MTGQTDLDGQKNCQFFGKQGSGWPLVEPRIWEEQ